MLSIQAKHHNIENKDTTILDINQYSFLRNYTANVYRELQGLYREIGVQGFQIYGDCM
jgi:hypothetical protein